MRVKCEVSSVNLCLEGCQQCAQTWQKKNTKDTVFGGISIIILISILLCKLPAKIIYCVIKNESVDQLGTASDI